MSRSRIVSQYLTELRNAKTVNQANKLHIILEGTLTPNERDEIISCFHKSKSNLILNMMSSLSALLPTRFSNIVAAIPQVQRNRAQKEWIERLRASKSPQKDSIQGSTWTRRNIGKGLLLFESKRKFGEVGQKSNLLLSFTGISERMMMTTADYLDSVENLDSDVLLIHGHPDNQFAKGLLAFQQGLIPDLQKLKATCENLGYKNFATIGVSAGALPSILSSRVFANKFVLAVGPVSSTNKLIPESWNRIIQTWRRQEPNSRVILVVGDKRLADVEAAKTWQVILGADLEVIEGAGHACLAQFFGSPGYAKYEDTLRFS